MRPSFTTALGCCCAAALACTGLEAQNPVTTSLRSFTSRAERNLVEAAADMPEDKYGFKPTPAQMSFGEIVLHLVGANDHMCSWIGGVQAPPEGPKLTPQDAKEKLVARLKSSFAFCTSAFAQLDDSKLSDSIPFFGRKMTRATEILASVDDWADHYSQMAIYMRLNGQLPPTARKKEM